MLPKKNRLTKNKDFENVFRQGKFFNRDFISLKFTKNNLYFSRFGFIVSLKIHKKAVRRNKIKRQLREIIHLKLNQIKPGFDLVVVAKPEIISKTYQEIKEALEEILKKVDFF